jgi:orotidine-5'-phosphate decarboxylase
MEPKERLICALDVARVDKAMELVTKLDGVVAFFQVGVVLQLSSGSEIIPWLLKQGKKVFLDMKYFDIPETVEKVVALAARLGVSFLTIHGNAQIIRQAVKGRGNTDLKVLAVTVLTSLDAADILDLGFPCSLEELVLYRAKKAALYGCDGIVASGFEIELIRETVGKKLLVVTPGIRPAGESLDKHKRAVTPKEAILKGADYLVVGRPITASPEPYTAAQKIIEEIALVS